MKSHLRRPVIYLPSRVLVVPCSYDPDRESKVDLVRIHMTARFGVRAIDPIEVPQDFMGHNITPEPEMTIGGAPARFVDNLEYVDEPDIQ